MSKKNSWLELYLSCFLCAFGLSSTLNYLYRCCKICKYVYPLNNASTMEKDTVGTTCFFIHMKKIIYNCEKVQNIGCGWRSAKLVIAALQYFYGLTVVYISTLSFLMAAVIDFYKNLGFEVDPQGIKGMFWYPRF